jgi:hypothetical protein
MENEEMQVSEKTKNRKICGYNKKTLICLIVLIVIAFGFFYAGAKYEKNKMAKLGLTKNATDICFGATSPGVQSVTGEVSSVGDNTMTIKKDDGSMLEFSIASNTKIGKKGDTLASFSSGQKVVVRVMQGPDGKFLAQSVKQAPTETQPATGTTQPAK